MTNTTDERAVKQDSLRVIGTIKRLLVNGMFPGAQAQAVLEGLVFLDHVSKGIEADLASASSSGLKLPDTGLVAADGQTKIVP